MTLRGALGGSIRRKTMAVVLSVAFVALLVNAVVLVVYEVRTYHAARLAEAHAQAQILGRAAAPALAFNDRREASAALASLKARGDVVAAALYAPDGKVFASYGPRPVEEEGILRVSFDIVEGGQRLGAVEVVTRSGLRERILAYAGILVAVMALALGAALLLSAWLQRVLTRPILDIDAAARRVVEQGDFTARAKKSTDDEIGALAGAFNRMLEEIDRRTRELGESEMRFRTIADSAPVLMWMNDESGVVFVNKAYLDFLGLHHQVDVHRFDWAQFIHPDDRAPYVDAYLRAAARREIFDREFRFRRRDGVYRWMRSVGVPRHGEGGRSGYTGATFDVHDAREAADALREADRRKDEFLATLAHELRNPLAPIRNALYILKAPSADPEAAQQARAMIERQVAQMVRLIDDLIDISRISTGKLALRRERVDAAAVARSALEAAEPAIRARGHALVVSLPAAPVQVSADATRLAQVFLNLLNNASKFTEPGGRIAFEVRLEGDALLASVRDNGIGIPAHQLEPIFQMFNQADRSLERTAGGLGVGLALSRRLVELHGGTIEARSPGEGQGSEFVVRIPGAALSAAGKQAAEGRSDSGGERPRRILLVDDNADFADSLASVLRASGNEVRVERDGLAGLDAAIAFRPDLAFLDIGMPGMNGFELAQRLRADPATSATILVAVTGFSQPSDRERGQKAGFDRYLVKPVEIENVKEILANA